MANICVFYVILTGSKDNVSAMLVKLPGAVLGPASNGGIDRLRESRQGYAMNAIDESPAFALSNAPGQFGGLSGMGIGGMNGMTADQLIAQMMMGSLQGVDMDSLAAMVEVKIARPRDQLLTKEHPEFLRLRRELYGFLGHH